MVKVNLKNYLGVGAIRLDKALSVRTCVCGEKIATGEKHFVIDQPRGKWTPKRFNFCKRCSYDLRQFEKQRLFDLEVEVWGKGGS